MNPFPGSVRRPRLTAFAFVLAAVLLILAVPPSPAPAGSPAPPPATSPEVFSAPLSSPSSATATDRASTRPDPTSVVRRLPLTNAARQEARADGKWSIKVRDWKRTFARGDQDRIDRCLATLWWGPYPGKEAGRAGASTTWLAGHNYCGFWRWDKWLPVDAKFKVKTPTGEVRVYRVYDRGYVHRKGGSSAGLIEGDLTLITCRGAGTSFTYAKLVEVR